MIDYKGLENALKALNDLQEQHPELMRGATVLTDNINANVVPDLGELYLMVQNDDNVQKRMAGVLKECGRFLEVFTMDRMKGFAPSLLGCVMRLQNAVERLMEFAPTEEPTESKSQQLPQELQNEKAKKWLQMAIKGGLLNEDYTTTNAVTTNRLKALLAEILAEKIGLRHKYKYFAPIWKVTAEQLKKGRSGTIEAGEAIGQNKIYEVFPDATKRKD